MSEYGFYFFMKMLVLPAILLAASFNAFAFDDVDQEDQAYVSANGLIKRLTISRDDLTNSVSWLRPLLNRDGAYELVTKPSADGKMALVVIGGVARLYNLKSTNPLALSPGFLEYSCESGVKCTRRGGDSNIAYMNDKIASSVYERDGLKMTTEYKNGKEVRVLIEDNLRSYKSVTLYKYPSAGRREECYYQYFADKSGDTWTCTPFFNNKKHGKARTYDNENRLTHERLYKNGVFVHTISKRSWYMEQGGKVLYYFDAISKVEDGLCVTRKVSNNSVLETKSASDFLCVGQTAEELLSKSPSYTAPR